jgi:hypothetical protein
MHPNFDHRQCPNCDTLMRLISIEPHRPDRDDGFERHLYRCDNCLNLSRFIFEKPPREQAA